MNEHEDAVERALTEALAHRLPRYTAPEALKRRLEEQIALRSIAPTPTHLPAPPAASAPASRRVPSFAPALAAGLALAAGVALYYERAVLPHAQATAQLETEAVNDHLRILYSEHPLEVQSGGIHQVKPWFAGRLDFAPVVNFPGDDDFPLQGGAVSYFLDRKAAAFIFKRRLHTISLFVFQAEGLALPGGHDGGGPHTPGPAGGLVPVGRVQARPARVRGFNVLFWRDGELGYALVSDVDAADLVALGARIEP
jgi:anti-sigma factor RsiW